MVGLDRSRYMTVLYNEWGTQTWLLIHSNESCSQGAYTKKSLSYFRTYVSFSGWAQLREIMSWDSFWWILNMLDLKVEIASHLSITLWCTFWWVEPYTNIWINFTLLSLLWHILGKSHDTPGGNNGAFNLPPKLSLLLMRGAAILDFAVGVGEVLLTFWVGNPTSGGHSSWNFQLGARKWLPSSNGTHHYLNCSNTHSLFIFSFQCLWGEHQSNKKEQVNCRHYLSRNLFIFTSDELLLPLVVL